MTAEAVEHEIWFQSNKGDYKVSIVAKLKGPLVSNVQYVLRLSHDGRTIDYLTTLDGFKELGELFQALHYFCKRRIFAEEKNIDKLKELLTPENIKSCAEYLRISKSEK